MSKYQQQQKFHNGHTDFLVGRKSFYILPNCFRFYKNSFCLKCSNKIRNYPLREGEGNDY